MKKGYTLSEVMVTMTILGILASILLPTIARFRPNKDKMLFKKAYYITERVVYELINDDDYYPTDDGFKNVRHIAYLNGEHSGDTKFCTLFSKKVNIIDDVANCDNGHHVPSGGGTFTEPTFYTSDGIAWYMPIWDFDIVQKIRYISVDVNGSQEPNCISGAANCTKPDIFKIYVEADGKMYVSGEKEKEYLRSNTTTR